MKRVFFIGIFLHLFNLLGFSQESRKTIIDNNIKAITKVEYKETGNKRKETKTYYTIRGDDSLIFINGEMVHSFTAIVENDRTVELERVSGGWFLDQLHFYKYNPDSSYSIEVLSYEEMTSRYYEYNSKHDCLLEVVSNSDTTRYNYDSTGKLKELTLITNGRKAKINVVEFDSVGNPVRVNYYNEKDFLWGFSIYKYNERGLQEEIKQFAIADKVELLMSKTELKYEF